MLQTIAVAGVGNLGKYICEELLKDERFEVVVLARQSNSWLESHGINVFICDYTEDLVIQALDSSQASALISLINCPHDQYFPIHTALLNACLRSKTCKRFIPSEFSGNIEDYPLLPRFYGNSREPFRKVLKRSSGVEWTLFNGGWLMDYFLPASKTHMPPIPNEFPVDPNNWRACIRGEGEEMQSFTSGREIGKAVVELLAVPEWEEVTYVTGEWTTFKDAVRIVENFYERSLDISYKTPNDIYQRIEENKDEELTPEIELAQLEEWMMLGAAACPRQKTLAQRERFFGSIMFSTIRELLNMAESKDFI